MHIAQAVADDEGMRQVVGAVHVGGEHTRGGLAVGGMLLGERGVYQDVVEGDALALERLQHFVVGRPESILGEGRGAEAVLVRDDDELEVQVFADKVEVAEDLGVELQLLQAIQLVIDGGLDDERAVAVDE